MPGIEDICGWVCIFLSQVSHAISIPLNILQSFSEHIGSHPRLLAIASRCGILNVHCYVQRNRRIE